MPTGQTPSMELFQRIIDFGAKHNILIVHDNPYSFIRNAEAPISIMEAEGLRRMPFALRIRSRAAVSDIFSSDVLFGMIIAEPHILSSHMGIMAMVLFLHIGNGRTV